jgi:nucleoside-diphosphate-sugar epimerase
MSHVDFKDHYIIDDVVARICTKGEPYFRKLEKAKILLTGGTGFFGIWLLSVFKHLNEQGKFNGKIYLLTRNEASFLIKNPGLKNCDFITIIQGDIKTVELKGLQPDHLIHFASTSALETFNGIEQIEKIDTLYLGTKNILEQCGQGLKKVLFASSGAAYGDISSTANISEKTPTSLTSTNEKYALCIGKIVAEYEIDYYSKTFNYDYSIARCFSFAGEFMPLSMHYAFGNFIGDAIKRQDIVISGSGTALRSYMYIGDAVLWFAALLTDPKNEIYNVGSDYEVSIRELAELVGAKSGCKVLSQPVEINEGNFVRSSYVPCLKKIKLAYPELRCWTGLPQIINRMINKETNQNIKDIGD